MKIAFTKHPRRNREPKLVLFSATQAYRLPLWGMPFCSQDGNRERLLAAAEGLQIPSSEADSGISSAGIEDAGSGAFEEMSDAGRAASPATIDETLGRLVER